MGQGCRAVGQALRVTEVAGDQILALDGHPALHQVSAAVAHLQHVTCPMTAMGTWYVTAGFAQHI